MTLMKDLLFNPLMRAADKNCTPCTCFCPPTVLVHHLRSSQFKSKRKFQANVIFLDKWYNMTKYQNRRFQWNNLTFYMRVRTSPKLSWCEFIILSCCFIEVNIRLRNNNCVEHHVVTTTLSPKVIHFSRAGDQALLQPVWLFVSKTANAALPWFQL